MLSRNDYSLVLSKYSGIDQTLIDESMMKIIDECRSLQKRYNIPRPELNSKNSRNNHHTVVKYRLPYGDLLRNASQQNVYDAIRIETARSLIPGTRNTLTIKGQFRLNIVII
jgi:hypothetical protein